MALILAGNGIAQEPVGGPYEPDSATVLLLHFNGNFTNESDLSADAVGHGNFAFIGQSPLAEGGQSAYLDNDSPTDCTFVTVADTPALDLTGSWTMESWVNIFTYGQTADDHRWWPRFILKPGENTFYYSNYFLAMVGSSEIFRTGYYTESGDQWIQMDSNSGLMEPGNWYHITFIRDTSENVIAQMIHDNDLNLIFFGSSEYDPITGAPPRVSTEPMVIGGYTAIDDGWFDGFVDEFRISNTVRNFAVPPIIKDVTQLPNQSTEEPSYRIDAEIIKIGPGAVSEATLHYSADETWETVSMTEESPDMYYAEIPSQPRGTRVQYYVSATDEYDMRATVPPAAEIDSTYYEFAIWQPNTQTLALDFESGAGNPMDTTLYGHEMEMVGTPVYSADAAVGNYSIEFEGDSSYLVVDSPFLTSEQFTVDFWFKADSMPLDGTRMVAKQGTNSWFQVNYQIRFGTGGQVIPASFIPGTGAYIGAELADTAAVAEVGKWYHLIYEVGNGYASFEFRDSTDTTISSNSINLDSAPAVTTGLFRVAHAGGAEQPFFNGKIDNLLVYNYPRDSIATGLPSDSDLKIPEQIRLAQNYPNPFNPNTTIRFTLPAPEHLEVTVYDLRGGQVKTLTSDRYTTGTHTVQWNGTGATGNRVASGVYFYRLRTESGNVKIGKMVLLR